MPPVVDIGSRARIEDLLAGYVHAIDNDRLESWPISLSKTANT